MPTTFTDDVRSELAATLPREDHCRRAQLGALLRGAGTVHLEGHGRVHAELDLPAGAVARRAVELLREVGVGYELRRTAGRRFRAGRERVVVVTTADGRSRGALHAVGVLDARHRPLSTPPAALVSRACCRRAYLRGALLAAGSVAAPARPAHLELRTHDLDGAGFLQTIARTEEIDLRVRERRDHAIAYAKQREQIESLLTLLGASEAALALAEGYVSHRVREDANRRTNADTANLRRQAAAAARQLHAIEVLRMDGWFDGQSDEIRAAAAVRERHPDRSLRELAATAGVPLPTLARRMRAIVEAADG